MLINKYILISVGVHFDQCWCPLFLKYLIEIDFIAKNVGFLYEYKLHSVLVSFFCSTIIQKRKIIQSRSYQAPPIFRLRFSKNKFVWKRANFAPTPSLVNEKMYRINILFLWFAWSKLIFRWKFKQFVPIFHYPLSFQISFQYECDPF